jgi:hypothetical protein
MRGEWFAKLRGEMLRQPTAVYSVIAVPSPVLCFIDTEVDGEGRNENEVW